MFENKTRNINGIDLDYTFYLCGKCKGPARMLDCLWPYHTEKNRCEKCRNEVNDDSTNS